MLKRQRMLIAIQIIFYWLWTSMNFINFNITEYSRKENKRTWNAIGQKESGLDQNLLILRMILKNFFC